MGMVAGLGLTGKRAPLQAWAAPSDQIFVGGGGALQVPALACAGSVMLFRSSCTSNSSAPAAAAATASVLLRTQQV